MKSTDRRQRSVVADMPLAVSTMSARISPRHAATWMLTGCGLWLVALRLYFIFLRSPLLPEDTRFMGSSLAQVRSGLPGLEGWLQRVFTVMGGFIAGTGVLTVFIAWAAIPSGLKGTSWVIALAGR